MRYSTNTLRCTPECLYGMTPNEVHNLIGGLHPTISKDIMGYCTTGWITFTEMEGSSGPVVEKVIGISTSVGKSITNPLQLLWCVIYFDENVGYYRPRFLSKEGIRETTR